MRIVLLAVIFLLAGCSYKSSNSKVNTYKATYIGNITSDDNFGPNGILYTITIEGHTYYMTNGGHSVILGPEVPTERLADLP